MAGELGLDQLGEDGGVPLGQQPRLGQGVLEQLARACTPEGMLTREARGHPAHQAGHPHHEELVEVGGEDGEEPHPLEQRRLLVFRQLENALVEQDPALLPVQVAVRGQLRRPWPSRPWLAAARSRPLSPVTDWHVQRLPRPAARRRRAAERVAWHESGVADAHDHHFPVRARVKSGSPGDIRRNWPAAASGPGSAARGGAAAQWRPHPPGRRVRAGRPAPRAVQAVQRAAQVARGRLAGRRPRAARTRGPDGSAGVGTVASSAACAVWPGASSRRCATTEVSCAAAPPTSIPLPVRGHLRVPGHRARQVRHVGEVEPVADVRHDHALAVL